MYSDDLEFVWDRRKSEANLALRGFDFMVAVGMADEVCLTVVYTDRHRAGGGIERRIISARLSNRKERRVYEAATRKIHA